MCVPCPPDDLAICHAGRIMYKLWGLKVGILTIRMSVTETKESLPCRAVSLPHA